MIVRHIAPLSLAKVAGILYAVMGIVFGGILTLMSLLWGGFAPQADAGIATVLFGAGAIVVLPVFYGLIGFVSAVVAAALYNLVAGLIGGVELDLQ